MAKITTFFTAVACAQILRAQDTLNNNLTTTTVFETVHNPFTVTSFVRGCQDNTLPYCTQLLNGEGIFDPTFGSEGGSPESETGADSVNEPTEGTAGAGPTTNDISITDGESVSGTTSRTQASGSSDSGSTGTGSETRNSESGGTITNGGNGATSDATTVSSNPPSDGTAVSPESTESVVVETFEITIGAAGGPAMALAFAPDGSVIIVNADDPRVARMAVDRGKLINVNDPEQLVFLRPNEALLGRRRRDTAKAGELKVGAAEPGDVDEVWAIDPTTGAPVLSNGGVTFDMAKTAASAGSDGRIVLVDNKIDLGTVAGVEVVEPGIRSTGSAVVAGRGRGGGTTTSMTSMSSATQDLYQLIIASSYTSFCSALLDYIAPLSYRDESSTTTTTLSATTSTTQQVRVTYTAVETNIVRPDTSQPVLIPRRRRQKRQGITTPAPLLPYAVSALSSACSRVATSPGTVIAVRSHTSVITRTIHAKTYTRTEFNRIEKKVTTDVERPNVITYPGIGWLKIVATSNSYNDVWLTAGGTLGRSIGTLDAAAGTTQFSMDYFPASLSKQGFRIRHVTSNGTPQYWTFAKELSARSTFKIELYSETDLAGSTATHEYIVFEYDQATKRVTFSQSWQPNLHVMWACNDGIYLWSASNSGPLIQEPACLLINQDHLLLSKPINIPPIARVLTEGAMAGQYAAFCTAWNGWTTTTSTVTSTPTTTTTEYLSTITQTSTTSTTTTTLWATPRTTVYEVTEPGSGKRSAEAALETPRAVYPRRTKAAFHTERFAPPTETPEPEPISTPNAAEPASSSEEAQSSSQASSSRASSSRPASASASISRPALPAELVPYRTAEINTACSNAITSPVATVSAAAGTSITETQIVNAWTTTASVVGTETINSDAQEPATTTRITGASNGNYGFYTAPTPTAGESEFVALPGYKLYPCDSRTRLCFQSPGTDENDSVMELLISDTLIPKIPSLGGGYFYVRDDITTFSASTLASGSALSAFQIAIYTRLENDPGSDLTLASVSGVSNAYKTAPEFTTANNRPSELWACQTLTASGTWELPWKLYFLPTSAVNIVPTVAGTKCKRLMDNDMPSYIMFRTITYTVIPRQKRRWWGLDGLTNVRKDVCDLRERLGL